MTEETALGTIITPKIPVALEDIPSTVGFQTKNQPYLYQKTEEGLWLCFLDHQENFKEKNKNNHSTEVETIKPEALLE